MWIKEKDGTEIVEDYMSSSCNVKEEMSEIASKLKDSLKNVEFEWITNNFDLTLPRK